MAREDAGYIRLAVAFNGMVDRSLVDKLPDDLKGDAIPNQILQHEGALTGRAAESSNESGARGESRFIYGETKTLLKRVRRGVLSAFNDEDHPIVEKLSPLGIGPNQADNQIRLARLATALRPYVDAKTIALVDDLQPDVLQAHAERHAAINKTKGIATAGRQTEGKSLEEEREDTREMLARVKAFLVAHKQPLEAFGFDLPAPPSRPRLLRGEPNPVTDPNVQ